MIFSSLRTLGLVLGLGCCFWLGACTSEAPASVAPLGTEPTKNNELSPAGANNQTLTPENAIAPPDEGPLERPAGCNLVTDDEVRRIFALPAEVQVIAQAGGTTLGCYYRLETSAWTADLFLEGLIKDQKDLLTLEFADAPAADKLSVNGHAAMMNKGNRQLKVDASPAYVIRLSFLPLVPGDPEPKTAGERKRILLALARAIEMDN